MQPKQLVRRAERIARVMHHGQTDKSGAPYIAHPERVVAYLAADDFPHPTDLAAAWLHDVVEDTRMPLWGLRALGMGKEVTDAVQALTHAPGETNRAYWLRVKANPIAREVKFADIRDNSDPKRLALLDKHTRERLERKYARARRVLEDES